MTVGVQMRRQSARPFRRLLAALAGALLLAPEGASAQVGGFDHEGLAKEALEQHVRPGFDRFLAKAAALQSTLEAACMSREAKELDAIRQAYRGALVAWSHIEHLRFGPVIDDNRFERIVFWPDRQRIGDRQIQQILAKSDPTALTPPDLHKKSVAVQGYTALETLLYGKTAEGLLADTAEGKFACGYATAIAGNVAAIAKDMVAAWAPGGAFTELWLNPSEQNPLYKAASGPTFELLKAYRFGINNPREIKLLPSLGLKRAGANGPFAAKSRPPFELSGLGMATIVANTEGVLEMFEKGGFAERLAASEPETAKLIKSELENVLKTLREFEPQGNAAFVEPASAKLALAREPFVSALIAGGEALASASGMVLGFTDDDGD
ncbi:MAG: imelysin family protein [Hyphomicrobiaceae bacterium]|nr:imelysin family protein [Hyphomicrobiaceae bacterium]